MVKTINELKKENKELYGAWSKISREYNMLRRENNSLKRNLRVIGNYTEKINKITWNIAGLISEKYNPKVETPTKKQD